MGQVFDTKKANFGQPFDSTTYMLYTYIYIYIYGAHPFFCPNLLGISPPTADFLFCFACFVHAIAFHDVSSVKSQSRVSIARP